jgi:Amidases related to nicotinamidase
MKLLICVDMQNDFITGSLGSEPCQKIVPNVVKKLDASLRSGDVVLFTRDTHQADYSETREGKHLLVPHCLEGTPGHELIPEIKDILKDTFIYYTVDKYNKFGLIPKALKGIEEIDQHTEIEIFGVATNICVLSCAVSIQNFMPNAEITIDASCCASFDSVLHEKALDIMDGLQMKVINR